MPPGDLPTFLIIGASKCGTTSLASYLADHPQIGMAQPKELNFFSFHWEQGLDRYRARFAPMEQEFRGEASTSYTRAPLVAGVPERIAKALPDARLIYLMRHPIERMRSEYIDQVHGGRERSPSFAQAIWENPRYLSVSSYAFQIDLYLNWFGRDQIKLVTTEALKSNRVKTMQGILEFVGADPQILPSNLDRELNRAEEKRRAPSALNPLRAVWRWARPWTGGVPRRWRHAVRSRVGRELPAMATHLLPEHEERIWQALAPDLARLREIAGAETHLWAPAS